jgi:hypothetical protein
MESNEFKCAVCKGIFVKELTDGEAEKQLVEEFGENFITEDCDMVCDDCFKRMKNGGYFDVM